MHLRTAIIQLNSRDHPSENLASVELALERAAARSHGQRVGRGVRGRHGGDRDTAYHCEERGRGGQ